MGIGIPGWHAFLGNAHLDGGGIGPNFLIGEKAHGRGLAGTMAADAVALDDGLDVLVKGRIGCGGGCRERGQSETKSTKTGLKGFQIE